MDSRNESMFLQISYTIPASLIKTQDDAIQQKAFLCN